jgi:hypothetical protein
VNSGVRRVVRDGGDEEAAVALGGRGGAERVAQRARHAVQRVADLRDLAGAGADGLQLELPARDPVRVGGEPGQRAQHPAAQQRDARHQRRGQRGRRGAERDRPARRRALAPDEQHALHVRQ